VLVLAALVASIALVDSLNPSTVGPAIFLALGANAKRDLAAFLLGVFGTSTIGGLILVLGPGRALLAFVSTPRPHIVHLVEVVVGAAVLVASVALWLKRAGFARRLTAQSERTRFSPLALGAVIIVAEFPTAFPYFAALAAIVEARLSIPSQVLLVVVFNVCFCAPILILLAAVVAGGERGRAFAQAARDVLQRYAATVVPVLLALLGAGILSVGLVGLLGD
jgi:cytochrome c biogenesis protein CcdA